MSTDQMMKKNGKSWIHPDSAIQEGIVYNVKVNLRFLKHSLVITYK